ncbi:MAG: hypothetical protein AAFZ65_02580 [Planctomycetota bacterium]
MLRPAALVALLSAALGAACDNPACVFSAEGCSTTGTANALGGEASLPFDGARIRDGVPRIESVFPSGSAVNRTSPIAIRFSESMNAASLQDAFRVVNAADLAPIPIVVSSVLVGDNQLLLLFPVELPQGGEIQLIFQNENVARDLTGQPLDEALESVVGNFAVAATPPVDPVVVTTWPPPGANDVNPETEIIAVFDREMDEEPFTTGGLEVTFNGGEPSLDATPEPLEVIAFGGAALSDQRVFVYRRTSAGSDELLGVPSDTEVEISLSVDTPLTSEDGGVLDPQNVIFNTPLFTTPLAVRLASSPTDAIGIANLTAGDPAELSLRVELSQVEVEDELSIFAFGTSLGENPELTAVQSDLTVSTTDLNPILSLSDTPILQSSSPLQAAFADGTVSIAVRQRRGGVLSSVRVIDVDSTTDGVQLPTLDTVPPTLVDLDLPGGGGDLFFSELRDLTLTGRASEPLFAVDVAVTDFPGALENIENSGEAADPEADFVPVVASTDDGSFIAAPVPVGIVPTVEVDLLDPSLGFEVPPLTYEFTLFDQARNASTLIVGTHVQYGTASGLTTGPGDTINFEVVDASTLVPIEGATVVVADYLPGSPGTVGAADSTLTDANGRASIVRQANDTVVTVAADGFGLVTLHGVASRWVSLLLEPTVAETATTAGIVTAGAPLISDSLPQDDLEIADSRALTSLRSFAANGCITGSSPVPSSCDYGPQPIRTRRIGAQVVFVGDFTNATQSAGGPQIVQSFQITLPVPAVTPSSVSTVDSVLPELLSLAPSDEQPIKLTNNDLTFELSDGFDLGFDIADLVDEPTFTGVPSVFLEARFPGVVQPAVVGVGRSFLAEGSETNPVSWDVEAVFSPQIDTLIEAFGDPGDLTHFVAELVDSAGNRATVRARRTFADLNDDLVPPLVPTLIAPLESDSMNPNPVPFGDFEIEYSDALPNLLLNYYRASGLFRVRLVDEGGRRWDLYRIDDPGSGTSSTSTLLALSPADDDVPAPVPGLASGFVAATVSAFAWEEAGETPDGFDPNAFAFSDLERRAVLWSESRPYQIELEAPTGM